MALPTFWYVLESERGQGSGPAHFLYQRKCECLFLNRTQQVRLLGRSFYDRQDSIRFNSDLGKFMAITPLGQPNADKWNREEVWLQIMKAQVDRFCRHNYEALNFEAAKREERAIGRREGTSPPHWFPGLRL
ncbi:putative MHC class II antigen protein [Naja naja]|nr:putative MHC class II antigen protein [Naja naja]